MKTCINCKTKFKKRNYGTNQFCSKTCRGAWLSEHSPQNQIAEELLFFANTMDGQLPYGVLAKIANRFGRSRERVRQIAHKLAKKGLIVEHKTIVCEPRACVFCGKNHDGDGQFCSPDCRADFSLYKYWTISLCSFCKRGILHRKRDMSKHTYCSKACQGRDMGTRFGWGTPGHPGRGKSPLVAAGLMHDLGRVFTHNKFAETYHYANAPAAHARLQKLLKLKIIKKMGNRKYSVCGWGHEGI